MREQDRAVARARRVYPRAPHFRAAYLRGVRARMAGLPESVCPYKRDPAKTWLSAWRAAWLRGYQSVEQRR